MARLKNAQRQHLIADYTDVDTIPSEEEFFPLARWINEINDASEEGTEEYGDYAGDGTPQVDVMSYREAYEVVGTFDPEDPAQKLVASKKRTVGQDRYVWHKIISSSGQSEVIGTATLSAIIAGAGEAISYEEFGCTISFNEIAREVNAENQDDVPNTPEG